MNRSTLLAVLALSSACGAPGMTNAEVLQALDETLASSRGEDATTEPIEVSTSFTIGQAVDAAAQELADFWESQAPCTEVTWAGAAITVDYGALGDNCTFRGHTYAGLTTVEVVDATLGSLEVEHTWDGFQNEDVQVDGGAKVTWDGSDDTRRVVTEHTWTDVGTGETVDVMGDHVWGQLTDDPGWLGGYTLDGTRDWISESGEWHLDMDGMEVRLQDPVPQAGVMILTNPDGKTLDLVLERQDDSTIRATITSGLREWVYDINQLGIPVEVEEEPAS